MKTVPFILAAMLLSGCVAFAPPIPDNVSIPPSSKVALHIVASEYPTHTYFGTTIFNNFVKEYEYDWQMASTIESIFTDAIHDSTNLEVMNLNQSGYDLEEQVDLVTIENEQWAYVEASAELRQRLIDDNVSVVISIVEQPRLALLNCSNLGCTEFESEGYGLFTKSFLMITRHSPAVSFGISIEILDPAIDLFRSVEFADIRDYETMNKPLKNFIPADHKNLTEAEMALAKDGIVEYFEELAALTVKHITQK